MSFVPPKYEIVNCSAFCEVIHFYIPPKKLLGDFFYRLNIRISMDGQGRRRDNIFIERLWKTVKYEEVYLKAYESITHARKELNKFFDRYNIRRPHQGLDERTPDEVYWSMLPKAKDAA